MLPPSAQPQPQPSLFIDPEVSIPPNLQERIDQFITQPSNQFSVYGPLNMYLCDKFPKDQYLVKPQGRFRAEVPTRSPSPAGSDHSSIFSTDSYGRTPIFIDHKCHPDFIISQYGHDGHDIARAIIEINSLASNSKLKVLKEDTERQLVDYMEFAGERWQGHLLSVGWVGSEVVLVENRPTATSTGRLPAGQFSEDDQGMDVDGEEYEGADYSDDEGDKDQPETSLGEHYDVEGYDYRGSSFKLVHPKHRWVPFQAGQFVAALNNVKALGEIYARSK
ncbi:hypothetical protein D9757_012000 [Collybiopsis confluens]|uniref:Uncharacterized protein n=1 Tax=Collybiopsis confluens TaxID=2823264 RepID=A0A8H5GRD9_9AGAR|nr:hypothetical protein D9757_012000 [Collybiopsis confluens]